jgi:hypothetical protein
MARAAQVEERVKREERLFLLAEERGEIGSRGARRNRKPLEVERPPPKQHSMVAQLGAKVCTKKQRSKNSAGALGRSQIVHVCVCLNVSNKLLSQSTARALAGKVSVRVPWSEPVRSVLAGHMRASPGSSVPHDSLPDS